MKKVVAFYRFSKFLNNDLESQKSEVELFCNRHYLQIVNEVIEENCGEIYFRDRKTIVPLIEIIETEKPDYLIVHKISGLACENDYLNLISQLHSRDITVISATDTVWTSKGGVEEPMTNIDIKTLDDVMKHESNYILTQMNRN